MKSQIIIIETNRNDGIMSRNSKFYGEKSKEEVEKIFLNTRLKIGEKYHLNGRKIVVPLQKMSSNDIKYKNGKYAIVRSSDIKEEDYWNHHYKCDILILNSEEKGIIVGHMMADCPVLIAEDRNLGQTAMAHCGAAEIDRELPKDIIRALQKENSKLEDIYVYVGSCCKKETYIYDTYPKWATNELWKKYIKKVENGYSIDLNGIIKKQLKELGITHIRESKIDTIIDENYYSHYAYVHGQKEKYGQNFVGFYYKERNRKKNLMIK